MLVPKHLYLALSMHFLLCKVSSKVKKFKKCNFQSQFWNTSKTYFRKPNYEFHSHSSNIGYYSTLLSFPHLSKKDGNPGPTLRDSYPAQTSRNPMVLIFPRTTPTQPRLQNSTFRIRNRSGPKTFKKGPYPVPSFLCSDVHPYLRCVIYYAL